MAFQVRLTQTAKAEIDTAYSWLRRNPVYADKWFRELMDTIATLL
jgi:plasmid stabilization system protein ParE